MSLPCLKFSNIFPLRTLQWLSNTDCAVTSKLLVTAYKFLLGPALLPTFPNLLHLLYTVTYTSLISLPGDNDVLFHLRILDHLSPLFGTLFHDYVFLILQDTIQTVLLSNAPNHSLVPSHLSFSEHLSAPEINLFIYYLFLPL